MPGIKQDYAAAAEFVAYVASSFLAGNAARDELAAAVANWSRKRDAFIKAEAGAVPTDAVGGGGGTSLSLNLPDPDTGPGKRKRQRRDPAERRKETWLTPYGADWATQYDCPIDAVPWGQLARYLKPLHDAKGLDVVRPNWRNYLAATEARYASPARFASTFGSWNVAVANKGDRFATKPGETVDDYMRRMSGQ